MTVTLKNGEIHAGTLEARDASTVTILTAAGEAKTFLTRQIQAVEEHKKAPESAGKTTPNAPASAPAAGSAQTDPSAPGSSGADLRPEQTARLAPAASEPGLLEKFQAPASGALSIQAGQIISLLPHQPIDSGTMFPHEMLSGEITADIPGSPIGIPSGAIANLEILQFPPNDASKTVFGLTGINIKGHLYKVGGTIPARLGTTFPAGEPTPRLATGAVLSWKLADPLVLREVK